MPYLQLDLPRSYPLSVKQDLAKRMGDTYAEIMQTTPDLVAVAFRELGEGNMWRCRDAKTQPVPGAVLGCEIRRGRSANSASASPRLSSICAWKPSTLIRSSWRWNSPSTLETRTTCKPWSMVSPRGGLGRDWTPEETSFPMMKQIEASMRDAKTRNDAARPILEMDRS